MTTPTPSEGESPRDAQSETVSAPHRDPDPPHRTHGAGISTSVILLLWFALGVALLVLALMVTV